VVAGIRPSAVRIVADGIPATVELVEDLGDAAVLDLVVGGRSIRARVGDGPVPGEGETIFVTARAGDIHLFDASSRKRL
jgi:ABC-type sugar transport system ATPase subunit